MVGLVMGVFFTAFTLDYLVVEGLLPKPISFVTEMLAALALIAVVFHIRKHNLGMGPKYIVLFLLFGIHLLAGAVANGADPGAIFAGVRVYAKYMPFFLLALVYPFSQRQISVILVFLLVVLILQFPVAVLQRFVIYPHLPTGDVVRGTLETSSFLSMAVISGIAVLTGFLVSERISTRRYLGLVLLLFLPTTLNETKGTFILLPIALGIPFLLAWRSGRSLPLGGGKAIAVGISLLGAFVITYDYMSEAMMGDRADQHLPVLEFFTDADAVKRYLAPRTSGMVEREDGLGPVGRIDRLVIPFRELSREPTQLFFGLGMGNVTSTPISELSGRHLDFREEKAVGAAASYLLWELGAFGVLLSFVFLAMLYRDARYLALANRASVALGFGWAGVTVITMFGMFYKDIIPINALMYPFWFFSGYIIRQAWLVRGEAAATAPNPPYAAVSPHRRVWRAGARAGRAG